MQEGLVYSEDEAVIMVGTLADEHEVPNHHHNHTLFLNFPDPIRHFQPCCQVAKWCQMLVVKSVFEVEVC